MQAEVEAGKTDQGHQYTGCRPGIAGTAPPGEQTPEDGAVLGMTAGETVPRSGRSVKHPNLRSRRPRQGEKVLEKIIEKGRRTEKHPQRETEAFFVQPVYQRHGYQEKLLRAQKT